MEKNLEAIENTEIIKAAQIIKNGGVVVFPTDTVYGIGANALNEDAIKKLYKAKGRPLNKKTCVLVSSIDMLKQVTRNISDVEYKLINEFLPGPLTITLNVKNIIPKILTNYEDFVGFRIPANKIALELIEKVGCPLATSSANLAGEPTGINIKDIKNAFKDNVDYYIDGGKCEIGMPSTIIQVIDEIPHIIRKGSITEKQIAKVLQV